MPVGPGASRSVRSMSRLGSTPERPGMTPVLSGEAALSSIGGRDDGIGVPNPPESPRRSPKTPPALPPGTTTVLSAGRRPEGPDPKARSGRLAEAPLGTFGCSPVWVSGGRLGAWAALVDGRPPERRWPPAAWAIRPLPVVADEAPPARDASDGPADSLRRRAAADGVPDSIRRIFLPVSWLRGSAADRLVPRVDGRGRALDWSDSPLPGGLPSSPSDLPRHIRGPPVRVGRCASQPQPWTTFCRESSVCVQLHQTRPLTTFHR